MSDDVIAQIAAAATAIAASIGAVFGYRKMGAKDEAKAERKPSGPGVTTVRLETQRERYERLQREVENLGHRMDAVETSVAVIKDRTERE